MDKWAHILLSTSSDDYILCIVWIWNKDFEFKRRAKCTHTQRESERKRKRCWIWVKTKDDNINNNWKSVVSLVHVMKSEIHLKLTIACFANLQAFFSKAITQMNWIRLLIQFYIQCIAYGQKIQFVYECGLIADCHRTDFFVLLNYQNVQMPFYWSFKFCQFVWKKNVCVW